MNSAARKDYFKSSRPPRENKTFFGPRPGCRNQTKPNEERTQKINIQYINVKMVIFIQVWLLKGNFDYFKIGIFIQKVRKWRKIWLFSEMPCVECYYYPFIFYLLCWKKNPNPVKRSYFPGPSQDYLPF